MPAVHNSKICQDIPSNQRIQSNHSSLPQALFSADNASRKNTSGQKNTRLFLHRLTSSYIFLCLQAPLVCLVVITSNSGLCEAPLGTLPWMPAMDVPVLMLP
jgi:hypothetical protein